MVAIEMADTSLNASTIDTLQLQPLTAETDNNDVNPSHAHNQKVIGVGHASDSGEDVPKWAYSSDYEFEGFGRADGDGLEGCRGGLEG